MDEILRQLYYGELNPTKSLVKEDTTEAKQKIQPEDAFCEGFRMGMLLMLSTFTS